MLFLAIRHLLSRKKQTILIFSGIALGTLVYVFIAGLQLGFREFIVEQLVDNDAYVKITAHEEEISEETLTPAFYGKNRPLVSWVVPPFGLRDEAHILYPQGWFERLGKEPEVLAFSEQLVVNAIASRGGAKETIQLMGVIPEKQAAVTIIKQYMMSGNFLAIGHSGNRVVAGTGFLKNIGARLNDTIFLSAGAQNPVPFKVVGSFELGVKQMDDSFVFAALRDVQQLNRTPGRISQIAVRLADVTMARDFAESLNNITRDKVESWDQANAQFLQIFRIQDMFRYFITIGILVVAAFGIYNVLSIIVNQKRREIAILRSLGYPPKDILNLFLIQGLMLGTAGAVVGLILGFLLGYYLANLEFKFMGQRGFIMSYDPMIYISGFFMAVLSSLVASILPARAASRLTPIDIIRMEG